MSISSLLKFLSECARVQTTKENSYLREEISMYPITAALVLWNLIALLVGSIFVAPATALMIGNAWLFVSILFGISLGKTISRRKLRQEATWCVYPHTYKPYLVAAL